MVEYLNLAFVTQRYEIESYKERDSCKYISEIFQWFSMNWLKIKLTKNI